MKTFLLAAVAGLMVAGALAYVDPVAGPEVATTCGTCQDPKPPPPFPVALDAVFDTGLEPVVVHALYVDGIRIDPLAMGPRHVVGRHGTKPGRCESCHPPYDICLPPCRLRP